MSRNFIVLTISVLTVAGPMPQAQAQQSRNSFYPDAALVEIHSRQQIEEKKAQDLEQKAILERDLADKKKREVEAEITAHSYRIEQIKARQDQAQGELESLATSLNDVNAKLKDVRTERATFDQNVDANLEYLEAQRKELAEKQANLEKELFELQANQKKSEKEIFDKALDVQQLRTESARLETAVMEAEAKRADIDADEMKVRTDWMAMKMAVAESQKKRDQTLAELEETRKRRNAAEKDLAEATMELARAEKSRVETNRKVQSEIANYEKGIMEANRKRIVRESDRVRLEAEVSKMKEYAARIRENRDQSLAQQNHAEAAAMKSTLALATARTELTQAVESADQDQFRSQRERARQRGIASAEEANQLIDGGRIWTTTDNCKAYPGPSVSNKPSGFFSSGKQVLARENNKNWVKVLNGSGSGVYVESKCGKFE